jgi:hypothetical protein
MPTDRQTLARTANLKHARGPKTEAGKTASSQNALKFGFFSRDPLIPGEDAAEWNGFRAALLASLEPVGRAQEMLAERIADSAWRLRRFPVVEAGIFTANLRWEEESLAKDAAMQKVWDAEAEEEGELDDVPEVAKQAQEASEAPETAMGRAFLRDCNNTGGFLKLTRYETGIERALCLNLQALERLQTISRKVVRKPPASAKGAKLQNEPTEGLTVTDRAA